MIDKIVAILLVAIMLLTVWHCMASKEHAYLAAPTFNQSMVDRYRDLIKDNRGMTLDDYALESHITDLTPLSGEYKIL